MNDFAKHSYHILNRIDIEKKKMSAITFNKWQN